MASILDGSRSLRWSIQTLVMVSSITGRAKQYFNKLEKPADTMTSQDVQEAHQVVGSRIFEVASDHRIS